MFSLFRQDIRGYVYVRLFNYQPTAVSGMNHLPAGAEPERRRLLRCRPKNCRLFCCYFRLFFFQERIF